MHIDLDNGKPCHRFNGLLDIFLRRKRHIRNAYAILHNDVEIDSRFLLADLDLDALCEVLAPEDLDPKRVSFFVGNTFSLLLFSM